MRNLWLEYDCDGFYNKGRGGTVYAKARVKFKRKSQSIIAVTMTVTYRDGKPLVQIQGNPHCEFIIGPNPIGPKPQDNPRQLEMPGTEKT